MKAKIRRTSKKDLSVKEINWLIRQFHERIDLSGDNSCKLLYIQTQSRYYSSCTPRNYTTMVAHGYETIAQVYMDKLDIPEKSFRDAAHLAVASVHNIDYLVTWNCAHLANGEIIKKLMKINESFGIYTPIICTPEELMEV